MPSVHFIVDGEGLTSIARNVWSYDPSKALAIMENIEGIDLKTARDILMGKKKLVGQTVCDDKACRQCKGKTPMRLAKDNAPDYYIEKAKREEKERKADAKEAKRLEALEELEEVSAESNRVLSRYVSTEAGREMMASSRLAMESLPHEIQEASQAMLDNMLREPDTSPPVPDDITLADGLVSPGGDWYSVTYGLHKEMAVRIWNTMNPNDPLGDLEAEKRLDDAGWLKVGNYLTSPDKLREVFHKDAAGAVTEPQKETMKRWSEKYAPEFRWNFEKVNYLGWLALLREG